MKKTTRIWWPHKGPQPVMVRFWEKVDLSGGIFGCWPWKAAIGKSGYGVFWMGDHQRPSHNASYRLLRGPIPAGLVPDHLCHNEDPECSGGPTCHHRRCVNPWHLEPVTIGVNTLRGKSISARNAMKTVCPAGHSYADGNLSIVEGSHRRCRICHAASVRGHYARNRERMVEEARQRYHRAKRPEGVAS